MAQDASLDISSGGTLCANQVHMLQAGYKQLLLLVVFAAADHFPTHHVFNPHRKVAQLDNNFIAILMADHMHVL